MSVNVSVASSAQSSSSNSYPYVVGIGASAGGLDPLREFFRTVKADDLIAYVVIQHLSSEHKSVMDKLLERETELKVQIAKNRAPVLPGHIYLIPPGKLLWLKNGRFVVRSKPKTNRLVYPIDVFFQSLAKEVKTRAIAMVLSGTGSDGTKGIEDIKESGGLVLVQSAESALFDGMPKNAMASGLADFELVPGSMIEPIRRFAQQTSLSASQVLKSDDFVDILVEILRLIKINSGVNFLQYRHEMIMRRIERRMHICQVDNLHDYLAYLKSHPDELPMLSNDLMIGATRFFRDKDAFKLLAEKVVPQLLKENQKPIRIWIPACSTGEEAYSIAIMLLDFMDKQGIKREVKIFATDINAKALQTATAGVYPESISGDVSPEFLAKYFVQRDGQYHINKSVRDMILFTRHNLIEDAPFNRLNFISCRNVMLYFQPQIQNKLFAVFNFALLQEGVLFLGSSESADGFKEIFKPISSKWRVYRSVFYTNNRALKPATPAKLNLPRRQELSYASKEINANTSPYRFRTQMLEACTEELVAEFTSSCLIISESFELLRYFGNVNRFLAIPREPKGWDVLQMMCPELSAPLNAGARKALMENKKVLYKGLQFEYQNELIICNLSIRPYQPKFHDQRLLMVLLEEDEMQEAFFIQEESAPPGKDFIHRIKELEHELKLSRESHQATIEELQAANEEMLAANEELQGTNEELQSVNEELYTINSEHQTTIELLSNLNDDMDNLLQHTDLGILFLDAHLSIRRFNQMIAQEINITPTDVGRPIEHFSTRLHAVNLKEDAQKVLIHQKPMHKEIRSQSDKWYILRMLPYKQEELSAGGVVITLIDITEIKGIEKWKEAKQRYQDTQVLLEGENEHRRKLENALDQRNQEFRLIWEATPHLYFRLDKEGRYLDHQVGKEKLLSPFGIKQDFLGKELTDFLPSNIALQITAGIRESLAEKRLILQDFVVYSDQGDRHYELRILPFDNKSVIAILMDISVQRQYEAELDRRHTLQTLIAQNIPDGGVIVYDRKLKCQFIAGKIQNFGKEGGNLTDVLEERDPLLLACQNVFEERASFMEWKQKGEVFLMQILPVYDNVSHEVYAGLIVCQKITDAKQVQRNLQARLRDLEQFSYSVSHDLKSPLRSISGFAQLLHQKYSEQLGPEAQEYLTYIVANTQSMDKLIKGLLNYARLGADDTPAEPIDTQKLVREIIDGMDAELQDIQARVDIKGSLPIVAGFYPHLTQLFQNLIGNGLKFNESSEKEVLISAICASGWATFSIVDNGIGIESKYQNQIFGVFKRLHTKEEYEGSGIGLSVCKRIVERLGGSIWVSSTPEKGSAFSLQLPLAKNQ